MSISAYLMTGYWIFIDWLMFGVWRLPRRGRGRLMPGTALLVTFPAGGS
jgi:hypothetical protein